VWIPLVRLRKNRDPKIDVVYRIGIQALNTCGIEKMECNRPDTGTVAQAEDGCTTSTQIHEKHENDEDHDLIDDGRNGFFNRGRGGSLAFMM
jgi:hypothetical protein